MRHEVPQFIDIADKIFGPLTFRQAIYLAGAAGAAFAIYASLGKLPIEIHIIFKLMVMAPFIALGIALAFIKVNKRPFIFFLESGFYFLVNSKKFIWKKREKKFNNRKVVKEQITTINKEYVPKISRSKLKDLAWTLDMDD